MLTDLSQLDTSILIYLNNLGTNIWDGFWLAYTEKKNHIPLMLVLLFFTYKVLRLKPFLLSVVFIALMATFTDQITNLAKFSFLRLRPCDEPELVGKIRYIAIRCSAYSFFSGHSSNSMAIAVFIGSVLKPKYPRAIFFLLFWAFLMGYSRIYIGVHYPGDVITGFTFGILSGYLFFRLFSFFRKKVF